MGIHLSWNCPEDDTTLIHFFYECYFLDLLWKMIESITMGLNGKRFCPNAQISYVWYLARSVRLKK